MVDVARLSVVVDADTRGAEDGLKRVHGATTDLGERFKASAVAGAGFAVGLGAVRLAGEGLRTAFMGLVGSGLGLNREMENTRAQFMAFTKDAGTTTAILGYLRKEADATPFTFRELSTAVAGLIPAARQAQVPLTELTQTAEVLAAANPAEGLEGAAFALREAVSGDFTSVIERFNLPRTYINQLRAEGVPALQAVQKALASMGYDADLVAQRAQTLEGRWSTFTDTIGGIQSRLSQPIFDGLKRGLEAVQGWFDRNKTTVDAWVDAVQGGVAGAVAAVGGLLSGIASVFDRVFARVSAGDVPGAVQAIVDAVRTAVGGAVAAVDGFASAMFGAGWNLMKTLAGGIVQGASDAVNAAISFVAGLIASFFVGQSPPPAGPLSRIDDAGKRLMETYGDGMQRGLAPVRAAVDAVADQFDDADITGRVADVAAGFDAARGHLAAMQAIGEQVGGVVADLDERVRAVEFSAGSLRHTVQSITDAFEDQLRPLERELALVRGQHDFGRDERQLAFDERDIALRRQEIAARGNKAAEEAARAARDRFAVEKDLFDLAGREADVRQKRTELPLLRQIQDIKTAQQQATEPLNDQLRLLERQKAELSYQKSQWDGLKATITEAVQAASPKGGGGGGAGGALKGALAGIGAGGALNLTGIVGTAVDDLKKSVNLEGVGERAAQSFVTGFTTWFRGNAPALIGAGVGAALGLAVFGPIGALIGGYVGRGLTDELAARGVDWDRVGAALAEGAVRVRTLLQSLVGGETLATAVNKAFGDMIPPDLNATLDAVDAAVAALAASLRDLAVAAGAVGAAFGRAGFAGALAEVTAQMTEAGAPRTAGALARSFDAIGTAAANTGRLLGGMLGALGPLGGMFDASGNAASGWGKVLDATFALVVDGLTAPMQAFAAFTGAVVAVAPTVGRLATAYAAAMLAMGRDSGRFAVDAAAAYAAWSVQAGASVGGFVRDAGAAIGGWVAATAKQIGEWVTGTTTAFGRARDAVVEAVGTAGKAVDAFATDLVAALVGLAKSAAKEAKAVGDAIVDGLKGPIVGRAEELLKAITTAVQPVIDRAKSLVRFGSPSRVFIEIGNAIVDGLRLGITGRLGALDDAFAALPALFRRSADGMMAEIDRLVGHWTVTADVKDRFTGYVDELRRYNDNKTAEALGTTLRTYLDEYLAGIDKLASDALPAVQRVREDLAKNLGDAVASAVGETQSAVASAASAIADAVGSLASSRALRGRRAAFAAGQSDEARARQARREDDEAAYQYRLALRRQEADTVRQLQAAADDDERTRIKAAAEDQLRQLNESFRRASEDRAHRRQLAEEDRLFAEQQARDQQAFEDAIADDALAAQLARIRKERDARIAAVQAEMQARQAAAVAAAQTALRRIGEDLNKSLSDGLEKWLGDLANQMRARGGPSDPGFLARVGNDVRGLTGPFFDVLRTIVGDIAGFPGLPGVGIPGPVVASAAPAPNLVWDGRAWVPGAPAPAPFGGDVWEQWARDLGGGTAPARGATTVQVVLPQGVYYGSLTDLARAVQPELARLVGV